ncbi:MAG TPA: CRISPR-associated helicase Cas3' [Persephonella sp.]|nr:CRISPR-associated helicase Cas3' [Persephonella sp.]
MDVVFYSHRDPFIILKNHLKDVAGRMVRHHREKVEFINLPVDEEFLSIVGISHDFGKYTSYFQNYIKNKIRDSKNRHHHGFISALFGAWLCLQKRKRENYLPLIAYLSIKHHHGDLKNLSDDVPEDDSKIYDSLLILRDQIKDLKKNKEKISKELGINITFFLENWERDVWERLKHYAFHLEEVETAEKKIQTYFTLLYTYSLLIDNDKKSASKTEEIKRKTLGKYIVEKFREIKGWDKPKTEIDELRNEIYEEIKKKVESMTKIPHISTITAPTGIGKTFLNLDVALRYRNKLGEKPRIIYALPFISIINQTYGIFDEILERVLREKYSKNKSVYLITHHHLSDTRYRAENEEKPVNESVLLIESWNSEIIITTFVQLLHSIIAFKNSFIKKFHNIAGSIIILDEVQAINCEYWEVIGFIFEKLSEYLGCKIILSTATRPLIAENFTELVEEQRKYFKSPLLKRTKIKPKLEEELTIEKFAKRFIENLDKNVNSYLIVLNTIKSSIEFYERVKEELKDDYRVFYLSTNIIPLQREERIKEIKELLNKGEKVVLISTQVVEAGVDLDFDKVYRDIGPLDTLIQVAGRCNRNKRFELGEEEVLFLKQEDRYLSVMIYGSTLIYITRELLNREYEEHEYKELSEKYFSKVKNLKSSNKSKKVLKDILNLSFYSENGSIAYDFKLIEELPIYTDVFIEIDEKAQRVYEEFKERVLSEKDFIKRIESYNRLKANFNKYVISVPNKIFENIYTEGDYPKIPLEVVEEYYCKDGYGLKVAKAYETYLSF